MEKLAHQKTEHRLAALGDIVEIEEKIREGGTYYLAKDSGDFEEAFEKFLDYDIKTASPGSAFTRAVLGRKIDDEIMYSNHLDGVVRAVIKAVRNLTESERAILQGPDFDRTA
jgi:hypothetical protein